MTKRNSDLREDIKELLDILKNGGSRVREENLKTFYKDFLK